MCMCVSAGAREWNADCYWSACKVSFERAREREREREATVTQAQIYVVYMRAVAGLSSSSLPLSLSNAWLRIRVCTCGGLFSGAYIYIRGATGVGRRNVAAFGDPLLLWSPTVYLKNMRGCFYPSRAPPKRPVVQRPRFIGTGRHGDPPRCDWYMLVEASFRHLLEKSELSLVHQFLASHCVCFFVFCFLFFLRQQLYCSIALTRRIYVYIFLWAFVYIWHRYIFSNYYMYRHKAVQFEIRRICR